jgi:hypothetical protein
MSNKKIIQKIKICEVLTYYHNLPTVTVGPSITMYFLEV